MIETFETQRLTAERLQPNHLAELEVMHTNPRVMATLSGTRTAEQSRQFLRDSLDHWDQHGYGLWVFRDRPNARFAGRGGIRHCHVGGADEIELAYALMEEYWRQGFGTEMARALLRIAFKELQLKQLVCFTLQTNVASQRVMQKVGFQYERDVVHTDLPHVLYRLHASQWLRMN